jgi:hypothetical protein
VLLAGILIDGVMRMQFAHQNDQASIITDLQNNLEDERDQRIQELYDRI